MEHLYNRVCLFQERKKKTFYLFQCEKFFRHLNHGIADKSREIYFQFQTIIVD